MSGPSANAEKADLVVVSKAESRLYLQRAGKRGVSAGGQVMIHGQKNGLGWLAPMAQLFDWTDGCIALSNADMQIVWQAVDAGTPIEIHP